MRVLLVRAGALGDLLLLRRAIYALRRAGHRVALLAPGSASAALEGTGLGELEEILEWERPDVAELLAGRPGGRLREALLECDRVVAFTRSPDLLSALREAGATVVAHDPAPPPGRHAADWLADAVRDIVPFVPGLPPTIEAAADEVAEAAAHAEALPRGFVAVMPGSGSPVKNWPPERYLALVGRLSPGRPFLLVEGPADAAACAPLRRAPQAVVARSLPLRVLGALLSRAGLFVGNDSGVSHLAAAFGAPSLVLFGPTDSVRWRPLGWAVHTLSAVNGTLAEVEVEAACEAALALRASLAEAGPS